jgi:hypothetical protein
MKASKAMYKDIVEQIINFESGRLTKDEIVEMFQDLIDTDTLQHLQGSYHRIAAELIEAGLINGVSNDNT